MLNVNQSASSVVTADIHGRFRGGSPAVVTGQTQTEFKALVAKYPKADRYIKAIYEDRE